MMSPDDPDDSATWATTWPGIPDPASMADEGATLATRLRQPREASSGCASLVLMVFALIWNGIVWGAVFHLIHKFQIGKGDLCFSLFLIPFLFVGVVLLIGWIGSVLQVLAEHKLGTVIAEIGTHPVRPGQRFPWQFHAANLNQSAGWRVEITCTERAIYNYSTNSTTHTQVTQRLVVLAPGEADFVDSDLGLSGTAELPRDAMHSFQTKNNHVEWALELGGSIWGWFPITLRFPFAVLPPEGW